MSFAKEDKSMKKLLGILLALLLCIALLPSALADGGMEDWTDYTDTSWYSDGETVFHISNAEELAGLAKLVNDGNTFNGSTVYLDADLDLGGREWTSIGYGNNVKNYWGGVFDGQGHTISRLYSHSSEPNARVTTAFSAQFPRTALFVHSALQTRIYTALITICVWAYLRTGQIPE